MTVDPRNEIHRLAQAVNDENFRVQAATTKLYAFGDRNSLQKQHRHLENW